MKLTKQQLIPHLLLIGAMVSVLGGGYVENKFLLGKKITPTMVVGTVPPKGTQTPLPSPTAVRTALPTDTVSIPTITPTPLVTLSADIPYPSAPLCAEHNTNVFHTLWNPDRGCHYDHEHGTNPFTSEVDAIFPNYDLYRLLGEVGVGHTNPSGPMENTHKHGGFKWDVVLSNPHGCVAGFEGATYCISAAAIQYHNFGDYSIEMEARIHSAVGLLKVCNPAQPSDCGYIYTVQHEEYGQRTTPYQGTVIPYPNIPLPIYGGGFGPYFTIDCVYTGLVGCRTSLDQIRSRNLNANSIWTSKPTGSGERPSGSTLLRVLFRIRDTYQVFDSRDMVYPFTFAWICSNDNGATFTPVGCRWNNSTTKVHEVAGTIPVLWDNLSGFDTNPAIGRITADGYTDRFGALDLECNAPSSECFPLKLVNMFVGFYGDYLTANKVSSTSPTTNPERDIYFCNGVLCSETSPNAIPSGWIGTGN